MADVQWMSYPAHVAAVNLRCCGYLVTLPVNREVRHGFAKRRDASGNVTAAPFVVSLAVTEIRHTCRDCGTEWRLEPEAER